METITLSVREWWRVVNHLPLLGPENHALAAEIRAGVADHHAGDVPPGPDEWHQEWHSVAIDFSAEEAGQVRAAMQAVGVGERRVARGGNG